MRRSEALSRLKHYMSYQNPYDDRDIEDQILDYCERVIGMLPPPSSYSTLEAVWESSEFEWEKE